MNKETAVPPPMDGRDPANLRGDKITGDRYYSREFAQKEWDHLWTKIWHIAGRLADIPEAGDFVVHNFMKESVIAVRQEDGSVRAFFNSCAHRGMRMVDGASSVDAFHCPYHGWRYGLDGKLIHAQDGDVDFSRGNPCGKLGLSELRCDVWGGFVWYSMDPDGPSLAEYLEPMPALYKNYPMDTAVRVAWYRIAIDANWKFVTDNFSESYHTRTAHPQVPPWIDQDVDSARHEMWPKGHGRTVQPMRPSLSDRPEGGNVMFEQILRQWGLDPESYDSYEDFALQGWKDLKAAKQKLWKEKGYVHYEKMDDEEITDSPHTVIFPNVTISFLPDNLVFFRSEPHPEDPEKCYFDLWCMAFPVEGQAEVDSVMAGPKPLREVMECEHRDFDGGKGIPELAGQIVYQDMELAQNMQAGMHSLGYRDAYLSDQETRIRFFHEVLNDWLEGRN